MKFRLAARAPGSSLSVYQARSADFQSYTAVDEVEPQPWLYKTRTMAERPMNRARKMYNEAENRATVFAQDVRLFFAPRTLCLRYVLGFRAGNSAISNESNFTARYFDLISSVLVFCMQLFPL